MIRSKQATRTITVFKSLGINPDTYEDMGVYTNVYTDVYFQDNRSKNLLNGINDTDLDVSLQIHENMDIEKGDMFILGKTDLVFSSLLNVKKHFGDKSYTVTKIDNFTFGYNSHVEIYGK